MVKRQNGMSRGLRKRVAAENEDISREHFLKIHKLILSTADSVSAIDPDDKHLKLGSQSMQALFKRDMLVFIALCLFRLGNSVLVQTFFVPDEYWQSLEVAHNYVFGYGFVSWEWEKKIRSYAYPSFFIALFKCLKSLGLDHSTLLVRLPKVIHALFAAVTDFYTYKFSRKMAGSLIARWALFCQLVSWFHFFTCVRTLSNCLETMLSIVAFYYFPLSDNSSKQWFYILPMSIAIMVRPTAAIQFVPLCVLHGLKLIFYKDHKKSALMIFRIVATFSLIFYVNMWIDSVIYGSWTVPAWNFFSLNVNEGVSAFYGTHPGHWYLSQGIPQMLTTHIFPIIIGLFILPKEQRIWFAVIMFTVWIYSLLPHKEARFLLPLLPLFNHIAGIGMAWFWKLSSDPRAAFTGESDPQERTSEEKKIIKTKKFFLGNVLLCILFVVNMPMALYFSLVHQRGPLDAIKFVEQQTAMELPKGFHHDVLFLMPCHSTPFYSHVHRNVSMRFLTCQPNFDKIDNYLDEADVFYEDPMSFLERNLDASPPTLIVAFSSLKSQISGFLERHCFKECGKFFHAHFLTHARHSRYVMAFCRDASVKSCAFLG